jgi:nucleotide-binding universal stress UspA family protein
MNSSPSPIVVAFDGSEDATRALHWAVDTAERTHQAVRTVVVALDIEETAPQLREYEEGVAAGSAALARDITEHASQVESTVEVRHGWTVPVLLDEARSAGLVVLGSRGHGRLEGRWLGSVSQHLAGHAPCPVAVVRPAHDPGAEKIVVGIDGSQPSVKALLYACGRAALTGEEVVAVHAYQYPVFTVPGLAALPAEIDATLAESAERLAAELVAGAKADFPDVELRSAAVVGHPVEVLARMSANASLVVVGSRGRGAFSEMILGSVAQETLHRAECPVVVVR